MKVFSTVDCENAFNLLKLDEESSFLCTFVTPYELFRYCRLPFGLKVSSEICQSRIHAALSGLKAIFCIADDILNAGSADSPTETRKDHDKNLIALLNRCRHKGIKLNRQKMKLYRETLTFTGQDLTKDGLKLSASKIEAIENFATPTDKPAVQRLIGFANYLARFCPNFSDVVLPLRELLTSENEFRWYESHPAAFDKLK